MLDFGYPQSQNVNKIEKRIISKPEQSSSLFNLPRISLLEGNTKKADDTRIPITEADNRNEIFVDVIENLHV